MKKLIEKFIFIVVNTRIARFFIWLKPNPAFFKVLFSYKRFIMEYYSALFARFKALILTKDYWASLLYNKNIGIVDNIVLFLLFVPLFRFIYSLFKGLLAIIYSFYYIYINIVFDLIIAYVDVYARKLRVFYDSSLIKDINDLRKVMLFTNFKQNFLSNFKAKKDINIEGFIYKEEFRDKFIRVSINLLVFFIWWMPLFLGFFSYIVRVIMALIWGIIVIVFWFFAKYVMLVVSFVSIFFIRLRIKIRIKLYKRSVRKNYNKLLKNKRRYWTRFARLYIFFGKLLIKEFNIVLINNVKFFISALKKIYNSMYYRDSMEQYKFNINLLKLILEKFDNKIINRLVFFNNIAGQFTENNTNFFNWLKPYILYFLNLYSFKGIMYYILNYHAENYVFEKYKYKYIYKCKIRYCKIYRKVLLIYWERFFPLIIVLMEFFSIIIWVLFLIIITIKYCLTIFNSIILFIFKALKGILFIIFFGKEK